MSPIVVKVSLSDGLKKLLSTLADGKLMDAARMGLVEHIRLQERQAVTILSAQTGIPRGRVQSQTNVRLSGLEAAVQEKPPAIKISQYGNPTWSRSDSGAQASGWNKRRTFPHTFMIPRYGNDVFHRAGKKRYPIARLWGPVLPNELLRKDQRALPAAQRLADSDLEKRVLDHITRVLGG